MWQKRNIALLKINCQGDGLKFLLLKTADSQLSPAIRFSIGPLCCRRLTAELTVRPD